MNLGFVVTTLGRVEPLRALLSSLAGELREGDQIVLVAQGRQDEVMALVAEYAAQGVPVIGTTSSRGASLGRNTGVASLPHGDFVVNFPNDTTVFPRGVVARLHEAIDGGDFVWGGFTTRDERGPKTQLPPMRTPLDKWNVWTVIEMGIVMQRSAFDELGGFDESIGPGASTPWQVAEGTDLLLRVLEKTPALATEFHWFPHDVAVDGISTAFGLTTHERRRKLRAYGRGTGRAMATHRYPWWWQCAFVLAGLFYGVRNPRPITLLDGWPMFVGRVEGATGRTLGQRKMVSATR